VLRVRNNGVPIVGFTWYSLTDQVDWDIALRENRGTVNPLGLFDLQRNIRAVGTAYRDLIRDWGEVLPTQSICLRVPIVLPLDDECIAPQPSAEAAIEQPSCETTGAPTNTE
jgi:hypothetical protein